MSGIRQKINAIIDFLNQPDNQIDGAQAFLVGDRIEAYEVLKNSPGTPKIAVGFSKGDARVNFPGGDITGRENQYYYCIISRGRGLNQSRFVNLNNGSGGGRPLFELAEILRDGLRTFRFDSVSDEQPDYIGIEEITMQGGWNIDGFEVRIWVGTQLPQLAPNFVMAASGLGIPII